MPDIRETLDQLDQRLADLRHQIATLADTPGPAPPPPAREPRALPLPAGLHETAEGASPAPYQPVLDPATARAAAEGVGQLGAQIEQLLTMRERLLADAHLVLDRYRAQLDDLNRFDTSEVQLALASLLGGPPPSLAAEESSDGDDSTGARPAFFQGTVTMTVTGATRIQTVQVLEDALSRVPRVEEVYIRRWHAGMLWLELAVSAGVELIGELNRVLPFPFAVQSATSQDIVIALEGER